MAAISTIPSQTQATLGSVLRSIHQRWIARTRKVIEPVLSPGASFGDRWAAVRYLDDPFAVHYRLEVALVGSLIAHLDAPAAARLAHLTDALDAARAQLDRIGRWRGVARAVSVIARELLDLFELWCREIEGALGEVRRERLSERSEQALTRLQQLAAVEP